MTSDQRQIGAWPFCVRKVYCSGGSLAICDQFGNYKFGPTTKGEWKTGNLKSYSDLIPDLEALGLQPLAIEFSHQNSHFQGLNSPDLRFIMKPLEELRWPSADVQQRWFEIGHRAVKAKHLNLFLASTHLSTQIRVCCWNLLLLCQAYSKQALALTTEGEFQHLSKVASNFSDEMNCAATATFSSLATLRDFIAKAGVVIIFGRPNESLDSYSKLLKQLRSQRNMHNLVATFLKCESWSKPFSEYRNFAIHKAPLSMIPEIELVQQIQVPVGTFQFGQVAMHLPDKIKEASIDNLLVTDCTDFESWAQRTFDFERSNAGQDTLLYLHQVFEHFLGLALEVAKECPVAPEMPLLIGNPEARGA